MTASLIYPAGPTGVDPKIIEPTKEFRSEAVKVTGAIALFIITYVLLVIGAIVLAILCCVGGLNIIAYRITFFTIIFGLGLISVGLMVLFFLFKFMFSTYAVDRSHLVEITNQDHPDLFEFIKRLTKETNTKMPKRVYLSSEVNAAVFYDSSFWSMFLPVEKNLLIGLGLVNSTNVSEFKAILAHEFGHFSQRSMKLGSYVYNMNKVIHNMLYDNKGFGGALQSIANINSYFYVFAQITAGIVSGIQGILKFQYNGMNERNMALSRQMEFHADTVAASTSGSAPLINSLRRIEIAEQCYSEVIQAYNSWYNQNRRGVNLFRNHTALMHFYASANDWTIRAGLIDVGTGEKSGIRYSRIVLKDQWASHPSTDDRAAHLNKLNLHAELVDDSPWCLFKDSAKMQTEWTDKLYSEVKFKIAPELVDEDGFKKLYITHRERFSFHPRYKGYYNNRDVTPFDTEKVAATVSTNPGSFDELLAPDVIDLPAGIAVMKSEIEFLTKLKKEPQVASFEYDGEKKTRKDIDNLIRKIQEELLAAENKLVETDQKIFMAYYYAASKGGNERQALEDYQLMFTCDEETRESLKKVDSILPQVEELYGEGLTEFKVSPICNNMKREEHELKKGMRALLEQPWGDVLAHDDLEAINKFLSLTVEYFANHNLDSNAVNIYFDATMAYRLALTTRVFDTEKAVLERQLQALCKAA